MSWDLVVFVAFVSAALAGGFILGRSTAPHPGRLARPAPTTGPPHKDLWFAQPVWFPWKGEWRRGRIAGPAEPTRRYYFVHSYDYGGPVNRDIRVAHLDLRIDTDEPLNEMCPPMSIVEMENELG